MPRTISVNSRLDGNPRYSDADMEPLLQALSKLRDGDFRPGSLKGQGAIATALLLVDQIRERRTSTRRPSGCARRCPARGGWTSG
jgi:hypothetical protein